MLAMVMASRPFLKVTESRFLTFWHPFQGTRSQPSTVRARHRRSFAHCPSLLLASPFAPDTSDGRLQNGFRPFISLQSKCEGVRGLDALTTETKICLDGSIGLEELKLLRKLLLEIPPPTQATSSQAQCLQDRALAPDPMDDMEADASYYKQLLCWLRSGDTRALYRWITSTPSGSSLAVSVALGASGAGTTSTSAAEKQHAKYISVASLSPVMFSEFLRCLDPFCVHDQRDYIHNISVSQGLAEFSPMKTQTNTFGIRVIYTALLSALMAIYELRIGAGHRVLLHDYSVLMRCAGAASDIDTAKRLWHGMESAGYVSWRQSALYNEFVQARFLTSTLYTQIDPFRFRVRPVNLHRQKIMLHPKRLSRLDGLRQSLERDRALRFGQNPNNLEYAEHMTRILRKTKPVRNVLGKAMVLGYVNDERLLASLMVALGRSGSVEALGTTLAQHWKIQVQRDRTAGRLTLSGGAYFAPDSPMRPSVVLLDAIVQAYCCNGDVACALQVVDYMSRRYDVAIPDRIWFDLLSWTYVMTSKPASTEWKTAGYPGRVLGPEATERVWTAMTSIPHCVEPGFAQYHILIKTRIHQRRFQDAVVLMRQVRAMYSEQLDEYEDAMLAFAYAARQHVGGSGSGSGSDIAKRFYRAANRKWYMWYCFSTWCWQILKKAKPRESRIGDDHMVLREIPKLLDEFRPFIPAVARYRTRTGLVYIREPHSHPKTLARKVLVDLPTLRPHITFQHRPGNINGDVTEVAEATRSGDLIGSNSSAEEAYRKSEGTATLSVIEERLQGRRPLRGNLRRRALWVREPFEYGVDLPALGPKTPRAWLVREFI